MAKNRALLVTAASFSKSKKSVNASTEEGRVHIHLLQLPGGKIPDVPFWITASEHPIAQGTWNADLTVFTPFKNEDGSDKTIERLTADAVFATENDYIKVLNAPKRLKIKARKDLMAEGAESGLSVEEVAEMMASI